LCNSKDSNDGDYIPNTASMADNLSITPEFIDGVGIIQGVTGNRIMDMKKLFIFLKIFANHTTNCQ
jgi:hypothetical protein